MDSAIAATPATRPQPEWLRRRPITAQEYQRMGEVGILRREDRVELIEGDLIEMSPIGGAHIFWVMKLTRLLTLAAGLRAYVSVQSSVRLDDRTEPEPDIALIRPDFKPVGNAPPATADLLLLVEVADTSLRYDKTIKAELYARHGVPEYWIVDIDAHVIHVHRNAKPAGYADIGEARPGSTLEPVLLPDLRLPIADLLA
jgi:Uma2 family endonuclease